MKKIENTYKGSVTAEEPCTYIHVVPILTTLESADPNGEGSLWVADDMSLIQNDPLPVDMEQCGDGSSPSSARSFVKLQDQR